MSAALALLARDVKLAFREGGAIGTALGFYLVVIAIAPLGLGPDLNLLARIAPGLLWVALLLAALLSADRIFHNERLEIPHPRMAGRAFVMIPLCEIDPDLIDPKTHIRYAETLAQIGDQDVTMLKAPAGE